MKKTLAMILAGGRVDELSVLTLYRPKSAVPFGGLYRVIDFPLSNLMHSGIERVGILSQYRSDSLINHVGSGASWDMIGSQRGVTMLPPMKGTRSSDWYSGTADAVYQNMEFILRYNPDYVIILSGDHVYKMDYRDMIDFHEQMQADLTISFVEVPDEGAQRFGQGVMEEESEKGGRLIRYIEKPSQILSNWASMTLYLFNLECLSWVMDEMMRPPATEHFGRDIFPVMLDKKMVYGYKYRGAWAYTRTLDEYWAENMRLLDENSPLYIDEWMVRTNLDNERIRDRSPAILGPEARVQKSIVGNGCLIDGTVKNSVLFPGVKAEKGSVIQDSILMFDTQIHKGARLDRVICDVEVNAGEGTIIGYGETKSANSEYPDLLSSGITIIGRNCRIPDNMRIGRNCIIYPNKTEKDFSSKQMAQGRTHK